VHAQQSYNNKFSDYKFITFHLHKVSLLVWYFILLAGEKIFGANFVLKTLIFNFFGDFG
jgi:hypothetical protein